MLGSLQMSRHKPAPSLWQRKSCELLWEERVLGGRFVSGKGRKLFRKAHKCHEIERNAYVSTDVS